LLSITATPALLNCNVKRIEVQRLVDAWMRLGGLRAQADSRAAFSITMIVADVIPVQCS
jgi:hypothetical protein